MSKHEEAIRDLMARICPRGVWGADGAVSVAREEYAAARREAEELRGAFNRADKRLDIANAEIARLRALLKGALVRCPECGGTCRICRRCHDPMRSPVRGYVPVEVEP